MIPDVLDCGVHALDKSLIGLILDENGLWIGCGKLSQVWYTSGIGTAIIYNDHSKLNGTLGQNSRKQIFKQGETIINRYDYINDLFRLQD